MHDSESSKGVFPPNAGLFFIPCAFQGPSIDVCFFFCSCESVKSLFDASLVHRKPTTSEEVNWVNVYIRRN